jgi:hypothetical protein
LYCEFSFSLIVSAVAGVVGATGAAGVDGVTVVGPLGAGAEGVDGDGVVGAGAACWVQAPKIVASINTAHKPTSTVSDLLLFINTSIKIVRNQISILPPNYHPLSRISN